MPDPANPKVHEHPHKTGGGAPSRLRSPGLFTVPYAELSVTSNFSFLCGASHPDELAIRAAELGYQAFAITDTNTLAGIVRAHVAARNAGIALIVGCRLVFQDCPGLSLRVYPTTRDAYGRLCRLLTLGKRRAPKGECHLRLDDLPDYQQDLLAVVELATEARRHEGTEARREERKDKVTEGQRDKEDELLRLRELFTDDRLSLALTRLYFQDDADHLRHVQDLSRRTAIPLVVTNDVHYHIPERRALQDVLTCIRHGCTTETAGFRLFANAERHLKPPEEMARLFAEMPEAIARTVTIANRAAAFNLDQIRYEYPDEVCPTGLSPMAYLKQLTWEGAAGRFPAGVPDKVRSQIEHEFKLIEELAYAPYFLTVHDIVVFARSRGILCQGRGAAANSAVCYCLGVTSVDPTRVDMLFERFVSRERNEPPDIDIDFEHERREEVIQYLYAKYGRDRAGLTGVVISYRGRSAVRDVGKALGLSLDTVDRVAKHISHWDADPFDGDDSALAQAGLAFEDRTVQHLLRLVRELVGFPRHLSQHVGGFVITRGLLSDSVPIENAAMENRTVIEWDKDDIEAMGMLKVDVLGLGMLTCIQKGFALIEKWEKERHEGTEARRHEGEEEARHVGTKAQRHEGIKVERQQRIDSFNVFNGARYGNDTNVSRSDCLAKGDGSGVLNLSSHREDADTGTIRPDEPVAQSSCVDTLQYRRGICETEPVGLSEISAYGSGISGGGLDSMGTHAADENDACQSENRLATGGSRSSSPGSHQKTRTEARLLNAPLPLLVTSVPSVPSSSLSSSSSPSCLRASVPSCLLNDVPPRLQLHTLPPEDPAVYDMICQADTIGVFQIESRAQMTMLPRLKPRSYYDLVIEVAIVRPGPIVGDMVHPFLRRRNKEEEPYYPDEKVRRVLEKTLGVPLFQEQAMALAIVAAGFTAGEAEQLRRTISAWKTHGKDAIPRYRRRFIEGMLANGYEREFAEQCFSRLKGFSEYGFPESHAASFALLVYASAWIKCYHPAAFAAALLNSQPMGFYAPAQIVRDAKEHGVVVLPVDVNESQWDCTLERHEGTKARRHEGNCIEPAALTTAPSGGLNDDKVKALPALRLGMRMIRGFREETAAAITKFIAENGPVRSIVQLWRGAGISAKALRPLALADAFASLGLTRQRALWELRKLRGGPLPLLDERHEGTEARRHEGKTHQTLTILPQPIESAEVVHDYRAVGLSLKHHPLDFLRDDLAASGVKTIAELKDETRTPHGTWAKVAGIVLVRQRPGTARGVLFMTIEDETGRLDLILRKKIYTQYRLAAIHSQFIVATGRVERNGIVIHLLPTKVEQVNADHLQVLTHSRDFH